MDSDSSVAILLRKCKQLTPWISLIILLYVLANRVRRIFTPGLRDIPGPYLARVTRLWNLANVASGKLHEKMITAHKTYGPIVRTGPWHISISDPEMIPVIYGVHTKFIKSAFYEPFIFKHEGNTMDGLFATRSPKRHAVMRSSVAQIYSMTSITQLEPLVEVCTEILMDNFTALSLSHESFDLGAWLQWYAFDVIGYMTFQRRFGFMEERRDIRGMITGIEKGIRYFTHVGQYPELHRFLLGSSFVERVLEFLAAFSPALKEANPRGWIADIVDEEINRYNLEAKAVPSERGDFLAWFRRQQQKDPARFSDFDIFSGCFGNVMAGSDTTAVALRSIIYHLIKTPRVYRKLQDEIDKFDQEGLLSPIIKYHESIKMPYLQAVIKESLRIHPSVGFPLERVVPEGGATLCGIHVPAGTLVGMNAFVMSNNTDVYGPDADVFRPERWIEASSDELKIMERSFLAFGHGTRICTGKNISMMEMCKLIPTLVRAFEIQWAGDAHKDEWEVENQWFARQKGLVVRFWPRLQRHRVEKDSLGNIRDGKD